MQQNTYNNDINDKLSLIDELLLIEKNENLDKNYDLHLKVYDLTTELLMENNNLNKSLDELKKLNNKYSNFYQHSPLGYLILNKKGKIKEANITGAVMLGFDPENIVDKNFIQFIKEDFIIKFNDALLKSFDTNNNQYCKIELIGKEQMYADIQIKPLCAVNENFKEFEIFINDITEIKDFEIELKSKYEKLNKKMEKRVEELLNINLKLKKKIENNIITDKKLRANKDREQHRSEQFARVLDTVPAAVWISHDNKGHLITGNQLSYDYLNIPPGANASKSLPPGDRPETFKIIKNGIEIKAEEMPIQRSSAGHEIRNFEFDFVYNDNKMRHMIGNATPLYDENHKPKGSVSVFIDITHHKIAEMKMEALVKDLERSNKELEQFAYITSHDLKEPLRVVSSFTQLFEKRYKGKIDQDADEFIGFIVDGAKRMNCLLDDLLEYARLTTADRKYEKIQMGQIVEESINNLKIAIDESNADIKYDELPMLFINKTEMVQLFQNLIANSIKFHSKKSPKIHISVEDNEDKYVFSVKDNGIGIDPKYQNKIFKMFKRLHTIDEYDGTGIGLSITKKIVENHEGSMWVKSELGKGSTFFFSFPKKDFSNPQ
jgi:two-component system, chemotaxis family, sensor kinase Cph1